MRCRFYNINNDPLEGKTHNNSPLRKEPNPMGHDPLEVEASIKNIFMNREPIPLGHDPLEDEASIKNIFKTELNPRGMPPCKQCFYEEIKP